MAHQTLKLIRYPGGKQRILNYIMPHLPSRDLIKQKFVEPFVGGGAVFFAVNPRSAQLADINGELINMYRGIRRYPLKVWHIYSDFPATKKGYYEIRALRDKNNDLAFKAARTLYLNRTCFKGMWRHNSNGEFNVGYGGQDRRWVLSKDSLIEVSKRLKHASLKCSDFEEVIDACTHEDFIFVDPPYRPGEREMIHSHYLFRKFSYYDHQRLANSLEKASEKGVKWAMTTSSHPEIYNLFQKNRITLLPKGTGRKPGLLTTNSGEISVYNYEEVDI